MKRAPSATMMPHSGVGGLTPRPIKESPAALRIAQPRLSEICTAMAGSTRQQNAADRTFGTRRRWLSPQARAASTQPTLRRTFTSAAQSGCRTAIEMAVAMTMFSTRLPSAATIAMQHEQRKAIRRRRIADAAIGRPRIAADRADDGTDAKEIRPPRRRWRDEPCRNDKGLNTSRPADRCPQCAPRSAASGLATHLRRSDHTARSRPENGDQHKQEDAGSGNGGERVAAQNPAGMAKRRMVIRLSPWIGDAIEDIHQQIDDHNTVAISSKTRTGA